MRIVIDTNVVVSAIYDPASPPGRVVDAGISGRVRLCAPESVREELRRVLQTVIGFSASEVLEAIAFLPIEWIEEAMFADVLPRAKHLLRDPDDAPVLACALALGCDIVSGDRDLRVVRAGEIRVWSPSELAAEK